MNLFGVLDVSQSALTAQRVRAEIAVTNLANAETTQTVEGGPFVRQHVVFAARKLAGKLTGSSDFGTKAAKAVSVDGLIADNSTPVQRYEPGNPEADASGFVSYPSIEPLEEMVDLQSAVRSYELNAGAVQATKHMIQQSIDILRS